MLGVCACVILCLDCYYIPSTQMVDRFILAKIQLWYKRILFLKSFFPYFIVSTFISKYIYFIFLFVLARSLCRSAYLLLLLLLILHYCALAFFIILFFFSHFAVRVLLLFFLQILSSFSICQFRDFAIAKITFIYIYYAIHFVSRSLSRSLCMCTHTSHAPKQIE